MALHLFMMALDVESDLTEGISKTAIGLPVEVSDIKTASEFRTRLVLGNTFGSSDQK
jgi:hypothetical protein